MTGQITSREQLENLLLTERIKYLETIVGILQPALSARLTTPVVLNQTHVDRPSTPAPRPTTRELPAPIARSAPPRTTREPSRRQQVIDVLTAAAPDRVVPARLADAVYGDSTEKSRIKIAAIIHDLRKDGLIETSRGRNAGYRWIGIATQRTPEPTPAEEVPALPIVVDWRAAPDVCWHPEGPCDDYVRGVFCGHCTDQDGGVICEKRHRREDANQRVRA